MATGRMILSVMFGDGGVVIEFANPSEARAPGFAMSRQFQVPEIPELADEIDQLSLAAERLLARALGEFELAPPFQTDVHEPVEMDDGPSPWDNPSEREGVCTCDEVGDNPECVVHG